jgi:hypothetical protein
MGLGKVHGDIQDRGIHELSDHATVKPTLYSETPELRISASSLWVNCRSDLLPLAFFFCLALSFYSFVFATV